MNIDKEEGNASMANKWSTKEPGAKIFSKDLGGLLIHDLIEWLSLMALGLFKEHNFPVR